VPVPVVAVGVPITVIGSGLNVPVQMAAVQPVILPQQTPTRASPPETPQRIEEARKARVRIVHPRKQARH
jgi:hypothetical protein